MYMCNLHLQYAWVVRISFDWNGAEKPPDDFCDTLENSHLGKFDIDGDNVSVHWPKQNGVHAVFVFFEALTITCSGVPEDENQEI